MKFRLAARRLFLTYSGVPESWNLERLKRELITEKFVYRKGERKYKTRIKAWVIGEERHEEGGKHYHCLLELNEVIDVKDARILDVEGIHGNYQAVKDIWSCINYVKKGGKWIGEGFPGMRSESRAMLEANEEDAKMMVFDNVGKKEQYAMRQEWITLKQKETVIKETIAKVPISAFQQVLMPFSKGAGISEAGRAMGLLMSGESESGKTTTAYRIADALDCAVMTVRSPKELTQHYAGEEVVLWDEISEKEFKKNAAFIAQAITDPQARTPAYYGTKSMKWPRKILLATNEDVREWKEESWPEALRSRLMVVRTYKDGRFQFMKWKEKALEEITEEEVKGILFPKEEEESEDEGDQPLP